MINRLAQRGARIIKTPLEDWTYWNGLVNRAINAKDEMWLSRLEEEAYIEETRLKNKKA